MVKYYIYLFRHGQTYFNRNHRFTGWKESKLTPLGIKQAKYLGKLLKDNKIDLAFQSSLTRSKVTLKEVLKFHPECRRVITDKRIVERGYGDLEGKEHEVTIKKYGLSKFNQWHRGFDTRPPGGESFTDVEIRVRDFIKDLKKLIKKEKVNVAISAHGNSIRLFRKIMENSPVKTSVKWKIPYDKVFTYKIEA